MKKLIKSEENFTDTEMFANFGHISHSSLESFAADSFLDRCLIQGGWGIDTLQGLFAGGGGILFLSPGIYVEKLARAVSFPVGWSSVVNWQRR